MSLGYVFILISYAHFINSDCKYIKISNMKVYTTI